MPTLNTDNQISDLALTSLSKALVPTFDSMAILRKQLVLDFSPMFNIQKSLQEMFAASAEAMTKSIFSYLLEEQVKMFDLLKTSLVQALSINPFPNYYPTQDAEIVEANENPITLSMAVEGRFFIDGKLITTISTNSKHGKLLRLLLSSENYYVTDNQINKDIGVMDKDKGIGYLRRDLKKALRDAGIEIDLYREREVGFRILRITRLLN